MSLSRGSARSSYHSTTIGSKFLRLSCRTGIRTFFQLDSCSPFSQNSPVRFYAKAKGSVNTQYHPPRRSATPAAKSTFQRADLPSSKPNSPLPFAWTLAGVAFFASIGYAVVVFVRDDPSAATIAQYSIPQDVSDRYHTTASTFDKEVDFYEAILGIGWLRSWITRKATGNVLEVSSGTGRNMAYYDLSKCDSITFLDQAGEMTEIARQKFIKMHPGYRRVKFLTQSAHGPILAPLGGFDTVLQTMGLCSTGDPVGLLRQLGKVVSQDKGRILLLEHGRSDYEWMNRALDKAAPAHADKHGCWWNRDIGRIVEESGLQVVELKRYHLGTTWWVELRP